MQVKPLRAVADVAVLEEAAKPRLLSAAPQLYTVADLMALNVPAPSMLVEELLPATGASLLVGPSKSGKTLLAIQIGIAVASGHPLLDFYRVLKPGPVLVIEQDDPAGAASIKEILQRSPVPVKGIPFKLATKLTFTFGIEFLDWLESRIAEDRPQLIVLDSYTALRGPRKSGIDIVKAEQTDLTMMDELAKRSGCEMLIIHHDSKGSAALDWDQQAAGTFAMTAATESQVSISRFKELDTNAPERLVRVRGRHQSGVDMVLRFRESTLDYEHVLEGGAASLYPLLLTLKTVFAEQTFTPQDLSLKTGVSRATAHREIERLYRADVLTKRGHGQYNLTR